MDSWRTHKYNCHLSLSLQRLRHTGTEQLSIWRVPEPHHSCVGDRSVCKTEYINTSVFVTKIGPTGGSGKLHPKDGTEKWRGIYSMSKPSESLSHRHTAEVICMCACQLKQSCINKNFKIVQEHENITQRSNRAAWRSSFAQRSSKRCR